MKAKKIWIAQHPDEVGNVEVRMTEPNDSGAYLYSGMESGNDLYVEWIEYVIFEVEQ